MVDSFLIKSSPLGLQLYRKEIPIPRCFPLRYIVDINIESCSGVFSINFEHVC